MCISFLVAVAPLFSSLHRFRCESRPKDKLRRCNRLTTRLVLLGIARALALSRHIFVLPVRHTSSVSLRCAKMANIPVARGERKQKTPFFRVSSSFCVACHSLAPRSSFSFSFNCRTKRFHVSAADGKECVCVRMQQTHWRSSSTFDTDTSSAMAAIASADSGAALVETGGIGTPIVHATPMQLIRLRVLVQCARECATRPAQVCDTKRSHTGTWLAFGVQLPLRWGEKTKMQRRQNALYALGGRLRASDRKSSRQYE